MLTGQRRPHLHIDTDEAKTSPLSYIPFPGDARDRYDHFHTSVFRSYQMEIQVHSPTVKVTRQLGYEPAKSLPVFSDQDRVDGMVRIDPQLSTSPGRLIISMEGAFIFISPDVVESSEGMPTGKSQGQYRHIFFTSSVTYATGESGSPRSASSIREAFANTVRARRADSKASIPDLSNAARSHFAFSFDIPRPARQGEELPPTCNSVSVGVLGTRGRAGIERAEVEYKVVALWEGSDPNERTQLEAPILFQPDADFQSEDGLSLEPDSWLEIPLHSDRPIPFSCAITLPDPAVFTRSASIPFFVVFTTKPRSSTLAREIAADATVAVSLLRQVTILSRPTLTYSPISSSSSSSEESDAAQTPKRRLLHRVVKSTPSVMSGSGNTDGGKRKRSKSRDKPLPPIPNGISNTRTLQTDVCVGFPKRPRKRVAGHQKHPSLDINSFLPDGLYKGKLRLEKKFLPSLEWAGLSVKYFIQVSVLFGQDELRARVPIRVH